VTLPYVAEGLMLAHDAGAIGVGFQALAGQVLLLGLHRQPVEPATGAEGLGDVYVDVLRVAANGAVAGAYAPVRSTVEGAYLTATLPETGNYVVRVQPRLLTGMLFRLTLELQAVLPFPVHGRQLSAVHSFFGDSRDAGARRHTGVDIFADRGTPVVAVAAGRAVPSQDELGGNTVWLNTPGVSYYYAHLERPAARQVRRVQKGEVLGYVGTTGNAASMAPHLHFGIYRWGHDPIDPLPLLSARILETPPTPDGSAGVLAAQAPPRALPATQHPAGASHAIALPAPSPLGGALADSAPSFALPRAAAALMERSGHSVAVDGRSVDGRSLSSGSPVPIFIDGHGGRLLTRRHVDGLRDASALIQAPLASRQRSGSSIKDIAR
jgi:murein DD-endopeptidase MepM/ murein hydrolase activator NlpD